MTRRSNSAVALVVAIVMAQVVIGSAQGAGYRPQVGERHPDFTLADIRTGQPVSLSDFRGRRVLLIQFASW